MDIKTPSNPDKVREGVEAGASSPAPVEPVGSTAKELDELKEKLVDAWLGFLGLKYRFKEVYSKIQEEEIAKAVKENCFDNYKDIEEFELCAEETLTILNDIIEEEEEEELEEGEEP